MSTFKAKRLTGLVLVILVSVGLIANLMKELEKQKLGRLVESRCAMDGLSKNGCKIKLLLAHLDAMSQLVNSNSLGNLCESARRRMELTTIEKQIEALNSLGEESNDLLTASDVQVLFASHSKRGDELKLAFSMVSSAERKAIVARVENNRRIQLNNSGT